MKPTTLDPTKVSRQAETLRTNLRHRVIGQDEAIDRIVDVYQMWIERLVVQPMSKLIATHQVTHGDQILIDYQPGSTSMAFRRETGSLLSRMAG
jgi:hypothetical protein